MTSRRLAGSAPDGDVTLPSFDLSGCLTVATGASEGIGETLSVVFAAAGARLALSTRQRPRLDGLLDRLQGDVDVELYEVDLTQPDQIEAFAAEVAKRQGPPTVLINCAGAPLSKPAFDVTEKDWDHVFEVGLKGLFFTCVAFGRLMAVRNYGKIINLSSTYARTVAPDKSVYAAAKAGVSHVTRALAVEWAPVGVRVNALAPTLTETPTRRHIFEDERRLTEITSRIPLGRPATPNDLVGAALFLATETSDFMTGQTVYVDGGWSALG